MTNNGQHRSFHIAVWTGRIIGWVLLLVAILAALDAEFSAGAPTRFSVFPAIALGLVAVVWIVVLELFLHFFDRYLSRN